MLKSSFSAPMSMSGKWALTRPGAPSTRTSVGRAARSMSSSPSSHRCPGHPVHSSSRPTRRGKEDPGGFWWTTTATTSCRNSIVSGRTSAGGGSTTPSPTRRRETLNPRPPISRRSTGRASRPRSGRGSTGGTCPAPAGARRSMPPYSTPILPGSGCRSSSAAPPWSWTPRAISPRSAWPTIPVGEAAPSTCSDWTPMATPSSAAPRQIP